MQEVNKVHSGTARDFSPFGKRRDLRMEDTESKAYCLYWPGFAAMSKGCIERVFAGQESINLHRSCEWLVWRGTGAQ